jgi:hypothetical protein
MEAQAAFIDGEFRPDPPHQLSLANYFGRTLGEYDEKVERTAAQIERDAILLEESFSYEEPKGAERNVCTSRTFLV